MVDVNELALDLARQMPWLISENVEIKTSDIYEHVTERYAAILTNPPVRAGKQVVTAMLTGARNTSYQGDVDRCASEEAGSTIGREEYESHVW